MTSVRLEKKNCARDVLLMTCIFLIRIWHVCVFECVVRLTVERTYTPPCLPQRGFPLKSASSVCLPAEAVRFCRSCWGHSYLSSWLASSVRSRNRGEHIRMSFVIKAGNRPLNLSWGMYAVTATVCVALWSFSYISPAPQLTRDKNEGKIAYGMPSFNLSSFGKRAYIDGGVKYVTLEQLALLSSCKSFTVINTVKWS